MASRVNTRLVLIVILGIGAMVCLVGGVYVMKLRGDATRNFRKGEEAWARGDYRIAGDQFERALNKDPGNPLYLQRAEECLLKRVPDNANQASELYSQRLAMLSHAVLHNSTNANVHLKLLAVLHRVARRTNSGRDWESLIQASDNMNQQVPEGDPLKPKATIYRAMGMTRLASLRSETEVAQALADLDTALFLLPNDDLGWSTKLLGQLSVIARMKVSGRSRTSIDAAIQESHKTAERALEQVPDGLETARANLIRLLQDRQSIDGSTPAGDQAVRDEAERLVVLLSNPPSTAELTATGTTPEGLSAQPLVLDSGLLTDCVAILELVPGTGLEMTVAVLERALQMNPDALDARLLLARQFFRQGNLARTEEQASMVIDAPRQPVGLLAMLQFSLSAQAASLLSDVAYYRWESAPPGERAALLVMAGAASARVAQEARGGADNPFALRSEARMALARGDNADAAQKFEQLVRLSSESDVEILVFAATALDRVNQIGLAHERLSRATTLAPNSAPLLVERANLELRLGRVKDARRTMDSLPESALAGPRAQQVAAAIQRGAGGGGGAVPSDPVDAAIAHANELLMKGDSENARATLLSALDTNPDSLELIRGLAQVDMRAGQRDKAREWVDRGLKANPDDSILQQIDIGLRYDDPVQATLEYIKVAVPDGEERVQNTLVSMASISEQRRLAGAELQQQGKTDDASKVLALADRAAAEAARAADELEKIDAENPRLIDYRLSLAVAAKDWPKADQLLVKARDLNLDDADGLYYKGRVEIVRGDYRAAVASLEQATQKVTFSSGIWRTLAVAYQNLGNFAQAERAYEQAYRCNPNDVVGARAYVGVLQRRGDKTRALQILQNVHRLAPQDLTLREGWLTLEEEVGDTAVALRERQTIYGDNPGDRSNAMALAMMLVRLEPTRLLLMDEDGEPTFSDERWTSMSGAEREDILARGRQRWRDESDSIIQKLGSEGGDELGIAVLRAYAQKERGNLTAGEAILQDFISQRDKSAQTEDMFVELGRYQAAINHYRDAIDSVQLAVALNGPKQRDARINLALLLMQLRQYEEALSALEEALKTKDDQTVRLQIVECLCNLKQFDEAERRLNETTSGVAGSVGTLLAAKIAEGRADAALAAGNLEEADRLFAQQRDLLLKAETQDPTNALPRVLTAQSLLREFVRVRRVTLLDDAMLALDRADRIQAGVPEVSALRVAVLKAKGDQTGAIAQLRRTLQADPDNVTARTDLIRSHVEGGDIGSAAQEIDAAIRQNPTVAMWYEMKGDLIRSAALDTAQAALAYDTAYELMPVNGVLGKLAAALMAKKPPDCQVAADRLAPVIDTADEPALRELYAAALQCLGKHDQAVEHLRLAYAARAKKGENPDDPSASLPWFQALGSVYPPEQTAEAEQLVLELCEGKPSVRELRDLARLWVRVGQSGFSRAVELQRQAVTLCPAEDNDLRAALNTGLASYLFATGDMRGAAEAYDVVIRLQPSNAEALNNLAFLKADELDEAAAALPLAERLLQLAPQNATFLDTVGWVYFKSGDTEKAQQHLNASLAILPAADTYVHLAAVLVRSGDAPGAEKQLQEAEKLKPSEETQQRIKALRDDIQKKG